MTLTCERCGNITAVEFEGVDDIDEDECWICPVCHTPDDVMNARDEQHQELRLGLLENDPIYLASVWERRELLAELATKQAGRAAQL